MTFKLFYRCATVLLGLLFMLQLRAESLSGLAITPEATDFRQTGRFIWADLTTSDAASASAFYEALFNWKLEDIDEHYKMAYNNGFPVAGFAQLDAGSENNTQWIGFISSTSPHESASFTQSQGGKVLLKPRTIEGRGEISVLADPEGAVFGVLNSQYGEPGDRIPEMGEWLWRELWSADPQQSALFYASAGYEIIDNDFTEDKSDLILISGGYSRAGIVKKSSSETKPGWLLYIRVENLAEVISSAESLGGEILYKTGESKSGFPMAIMADITGGIFAAIEWQPQEVE